ncbi:hypothetical protein MIND_00835300 [Mycena indigotica]|uniref:BTB domain-containing protein n=1 Tax=Mycena indigotica TaxID=2126181 RepID=A0A8H6VYJ2_9AGAR|nr:uncharacterized protein MIND_00835300 [Mycena indigotica]KAF7298874.1 hypothetical protein MIND_00835300 [Mycena indigotica]
MALQRGEPWFDDGNVVLATSAEGIAFRVHRGVMARYSSRCFWSLSRQRSLSKLSITVKWFGCGMLPAELANLIVALYDGVKFHNACLEDWFHLAGILRLSTKYFVNKLRIQAIEYLAQTWANTLAGHDHMVEAALRTPPVDGLTYPWVHPLHVLNLAREVNVRVVIPSVIYFLSLYQLEDILRADHPKLNKIDHPSRPSSTFSPHDIKDYTLMFQKRLEVILHFVRTFCGTRTPTAKCQSTEACSRGFARLASRLGRSWISRTGPLHYMSQAVGDLADKAEVCKLCQRAFGDDVAALREQTWNELPSVIGMPSWDELVAIDLHGG